MKPVRIALYAPGSNERVMNKALESGADAVILDLEDSVALAAKPEARTLVAKVIDGVAAAERAAPAIFVRVNSSDAAMLAEDLAAVVRPGLDLIAFPKAESVEQVRDLAAALDRLEAARSMKRGTVAISVGIESALGVYRCYDLITASPRVAVACLGTARDGDLQADLGCGWSLEGTELLYARSKVLLDARAANADIYPMTGPYADLNDEAGLIEDSKLCARLGYVGRNVIHPKQIAPAQRAYAVPAEDVAYYQKVIAEFEAGEKAGVAAIKVDGKLVDYAMVKRARRVLGLAQPDR